MHGTAGGDLQEAAALGPVEIPFQPDFAPDLVEHALFRLAVLTVLGVNPRMVEADLDAIECESFPLRIHAECHRRSRAECGEQVLVGPRSAIGATEGFRFIADEAVRPDLDLLRESLPGNGAHDYLGCHVHLPTGQILSSIR